MFKAEIAFSGFGFLNLGAASHRDPKPKSATFLMPRNKSNFDFHLANICFHLDDVRRPEGEIFGKTDIGSDGSTLVKLSLYREIVKITVDADPMPNDRFLVDWDGSLAASVGLRTMGAFDRLPRLVEDLKVAHIVPAATGLDSGLYISSVELPAGVFFSRRPLLTADGSPAAFQVLGGRSTSLADQIVWVRDNVRSVTISFRQGPEIVLDGSTRRDWGEDQVIRMAVTNLPDVATSGREWSPHDLGMFRVVNNDAAVNEIRRATPLPVPVTPHSSCPPAINETIGI